MSTEAHRVFLSLGNTDVASARLHARELLARTSGRFELFLMGQRTALDALGANDFDLGASFQSVVLPAPGSHSAALAHILGSCRDRDFLFVKSGVVVPEDWNIRLAWTAEHFPGVATVSPVFDDDFLATGPSGDTPFRSLSPEAMDRLCYRHSQFGFNERSDYREECVYMRREAVQAALADETAPAERIQRFRASVHKLRYSHLLADHVFARGPAPASGAFSGEPPLPLSVLQQEISAALSRGADFAPPVREYMRPRVLHVMHSWGGGLERWVREYCQADCFHDNLILKSIGRWGAFGMELALHRHGDDGPVETWPIDPIVKSTASRHAGYRAALARIVDTYGIEAILVSSLIGHSLDVFDFGIPVAMVCHDYYPFCPALNITFNELCKSCDAARLTCCTAENPHHRFFRNTPPRQWIDLRSAFVQRVLEKRPALIAPSPSVRDNYARLVPEVADRFQLIPHGTRPLSSGPLRLDPRPERAGQDRLSVLILGSLAPHKGGGIVKSIQREILEFCDLFLVGCGDFALDPDSDSGITIIREYRWDSLPGLLGKLGPDLALLPSVVPETFSFTLQELFELAIPTLATDLGSFHDRIQDGVNGFLCRPEAPHVLARLKELNVDRESLARVHRHLATAKVRRVTDMLADYRAVLGAPAASRKAYFCADSRHPSPISPLGRSMVRWQPTQRSFASPPFRSGGEPLRVKLDWPEQDATTTTFQFQPSGHAGVVVLYGLQLHDRQGHLLWTWKSDLEALEPRALPGPHSGSAIVYLREGQTDVSLVLPMQLIEELRWGGSLVAEFEWPSPEQAELILNSLGLGLAPRSDLVSPPESLSASRSPFQQSILELEQAQAVILDLRRKLDQAQAMNLDLRQSLSWRAMQPLRMCGDLYFKATSFLRRSL